VSDDRGMPLDSDVCHCGAPVLDHTVRLLREHHPAEKLNLPYEESGTLTWTNVADQHGDIASAIVVKAAAIGLPDVPPGYPKTLPALGFTFFGMDGLTTVAKALLVLDVDHMRGVRRIVGDAIDGSLNAARRTR
jgi:hypothetical protein